MTSPLPQNEASTATETPKSRNPVERAVVRGLIALMLVLVGIEAMAKFGYDRSFAALTAAVAKAETSNETLTIERVPSLLSGFYNVKDEGVAEQPLDRTATYRWPSIFKNYGLTLRYRSGFGVVVALASENAPPEEPAPVSIESISNASSGSAAEGDATANPQAGGEGRPMGQEGAGGRPMGQGGGRRGGFDPMQRDADKDGRLSKEEVSERMLAIFDTIDTNSDGFLNAEELAAWRASNPGRGGRPSSDTPANPPSDPASPTPTAPAAPPAEGTPPQ